MDKIPMTGVNFTNADEGTHEITCNITNEEADTHDEPEGVTTKGAT